MAANKYQLNENQKGYLFIFIGIIMLLYAFNFFQEWLNILVILAGIGLIAYGFIRVDGLEKVRSILSQNRR